MTKRKFFKRIVMVEVLSEDKPISDELSLEDINHVITEGDCSGVVKFREPKELDGKQAARALIAQGSDPEFFLIDKNGEDCKEEDYEE